MSIRQLTDLAQDFDSIRRFNAVAGDVTPDFEEITGGLRPELIEAHA